MNSALQQRIFGVHTQVDESGIIGHDLTYLLRAQEQASLTD
jgi:hypothetical protein